MEFSGGIQFGGGIQLTAPPVITVNTIPNNTIAPVVSGLANVGRTLSCTTGTWEGTLPITYTYQWRRYSGSYTNITSATSNTYVLVNDDLNRVISCTVTATNSAGSASANSNGTLDVTVAQGYPWIVSESPEYANWATYNGIVSFDVSWGRRRIFNSTGAPRSDMSANNQVIIRLPISSVAGGTANAYLDGNDGDWFGGKTFSNAEVNVFVSAMTTGTEIVFYNTSQNKAGTLTLTDDARIVERSPIAGMSGGRMVVANVNASFKDGISDNANEIVYGSANASIGEWFMYGSANVVLSSNILTTLIGLPNTQAQTQEYPWALAKDPTSYREDPIYFNGVYTGNIKGGNLAMIHPNPDLANYWGYTFYTSTGFGARNGDIIWGRSAVFNSTGAPRSDMSANNQVIIGLPLVAYESHGYGQANIFLNGTDGMFNNGKFFSNSEVNVFVSAMTTGTRIKFNNSSSIELILTDNARIVERSPVTSAGINGVRMIVANVNTSFKDGISDNAGEIVDASANASIGEWFIYGSANILLKSNILLTYASS